MCFSISQFSNEINYKKYRFYLQEVIQINFRKTLTEVHGMRRNSTRIQFLHIISCFTAIYAQDLM